MRVVHACCLVTTARSCALASTIAELVHKSLAVHWAARASQAIGAVNDHTQEAFDTLLITRSYQAHKIDPELVSHAEEVVNLMSD